MVKIANESACQRGAHATVYLRKIPTVKVCSGPDENRRAKALEKHPWSLQVRRICMNREQFSVFSLPAAKRWRGGVKWLSAFLRGSFFEYPWVWTAL